MMYISLFCVISMLMFFLFAFFNSENDQPPVPKKSKGKQANKMQATSWKMQTDDDTVPQAL